ncbi:MAG: hypothetical protein AVO35_03460 [Candidatus Aegiribacteria sp. MLS_C]|nr:MAG: hypothetical protein AVO35_03460 [Candidatus Aegiribacteria sp. MLS_C]
MRRNRELSVLVVEDDHLVTEMVRGMLEELEYRVAGEAEDGHEALEKVRELRPDAVIMDLKMPRMSGIQAAILIQKHFPTPVVVLTAYDTEELREEADRAGVGAYVIKPPKPDELSWAIETAVERFGDMMRIRQLALELEDAKRRAVRIASLLPVCPSCGGSRTGGDYDGRLSALFDELNSAEREACLCSECRKREV